MDRQIVELEADHPGFNDVSYRRRRDEIAALAREAAEGDISTADYTEMERETWATVFDQLVSLYATHACQEFNEVIAELDYTRDEIPQLSSVSSFLNQRTGFNLQPVAGLVSAREFLGALGDSVFCATQYIRHSSQPFYTPEPDVVHELMGHAPMLAIPEFAELSRRIGRGSIGASNQEIEQLATLYWFTVEYGVVYEEDGLKAYGAGLLSSYGELEHAISGSPEIRPFDSQQAKDTQYPITTFQPLLWSVTSIGEALREVDGFLKR
ncbi:MAG: phenylalanine 4-monooxygenase [bacterium]|nr:phenylalanine 4-monooxygenase [bacterium]